MKKLISIVAALTFSMGSANALAQAEPSRGVTVETVSPRSQEFTFSDQLVPGQLPRPDGSTVVGPRHHVGATLVRLRAHFVPEMLKSVEHL